MVYERRLAEDGVLGLYGWNGIVYAGVRGALYEADDRWRDDGPSDSLPLSLAFRNRAYLAGLSGPLQGDSVLYDDTSKARIVVSSTDAYAYVFDVWVKLSEIRNYQTVLWLGALSTDSAQLAGTSANKIQYWWRFNNGRPELVLGSTATYDGSNRPEKGLFVAQGATAIQAGEWTHVRITLPSASSGANVRVPYMQINGKSIGVTVNARANGLSGTNWITAASLVTAGSTPSTSILVGAARDSYRAPEPTLTWVNGVVGQPLQVSPQRIQGLLHSLGGRVALCAVTRQPWSGSAPSNFDPYTVSYDVGGIFTAFFLDVQSLGVGHKVQDIATQIYGPIYSSPFVSVFHEMGTSKNPYAFAEYGSQMYATNGGRPVVVFPEVSRA
jgi:hypothetical protein